MACCALGQPGGDVWTDKQLEKLPFYRTSSPIGAAAQKVRDLTEDKEMMVWVGGIENIMRHALVMFYIDFVKLRDCLVQRSGSRSRNVLVFFKYTVK